jgi:hypothetical protein
MMTARAASAANSSISRKKMGMGDLHELLERRGLGNAAMTLQLLANVLQAQGSSRLSSPLVPLLRLLPRRFCGPATSAASNGL